VIAWKHAARNRNFFLQFTFCGQLENFVNRDVLVDEDMVDSSLEFDCVIRPLGVSLHIGNTFLVVIVDALQLKIFFRLSPSIVSLFVSLAFFTFQQLRLLLENAFTMQQIKRWATWQSVKVTTEN
jgi:hypothetical protein